MCKDSSKLNHLLLVRLFSGLLAFVVTYKWQDTLANGGRTVRANNHPHIHRGLEEGKLQLQICNSHGGGSWSQPRS